MPACRDRLAGLDLQCGPAHAGLLLARYPRAAVQDDAFATEKRELHAAARAAAHAVEPLYKRAFARWKQSLAGPATVAGSFRVQGRLVVGLGGEHVLETGLTLHHIYGTPIIAGAALKGLAAHYCDQVWGAAEPEFRKTGKHHQALFGTPDTAGHVVFHDAWLEPGALTGPDTGLTPDVLTPHHGPYYAGEVDAPTDFDGPNPVTFLSVAGSFHVAVSYEVPDESGRKWAQLASGLLTAALADWGVGGKTSSGYGRLAPSSPAAAAARPRHMPGTAVRIERVVETTRKHAPKFRADDDFLGHFAPGEAPPSIAIGEFIDAWVANRNDQGYTFTLKQPKTRPAQHSTRGDRRR